MNNIKELHPKDGVTLLAYKAPTWFIRAQVSMGYLLVAMHNVSNMVTTDELENPIKCNNYLANHDQKKDFVTHPVKLPFNCKLLGITTEITEEVWQGVMPEPEIISEVDNGHDIKEVYGYSDFTDEDNSFNTATESAMSFLEVNDVYSVNPKLHPADIETMSIEHYIRLEDNWNKAEANTGTWVILLKI